MKVVLDTNVISELAKRVPEPSVGAWAEGFPPETLWTTSTTISEIVQGVMQMPEGRRKNEVDDRMMIAIGAFYDRTLLFDGNAAVEYGRFLPDHVSSGRSIKRSDAQVAACCISAGATLATRNVKDFEEIPGLEVINPWEVS